MKGQTPEIRFGPLLAPRRQNFDHLAVAKKCPPGAGSRPRSSRFCRWHSTVGAAWKGGGTRFGTDPVQNLAQNWSRICPRTGPVFVPELVQGLSQNWSRVCPRTGTGFGPELVQGLARIWSRECQRSGSGCRDLGLGVYNFVTGFHIKTPPRYRKWTSSGTENGPVLGQELDQFWDRG